MKKCELLKERKYQEKASALVTDIIIVLGLSEGCKKVVKLL